MNTSSRTSFLEEIKDTETRQLHVAAQIRVGVPLQLRAMRESRGWTQERLAKTIGTTQNSVSRLESPQYGRATISTLLRVAEAFDVALIVRFVPFSDFADVVTGMSVDSVAVPSFSEDKRLQEEYEPAYNFAPQRTGENAAAVPSMGPIDIGQFRADRQKGAGRDQFGREQLGSIAERLKVTKRQYEGKDNGISKGGRSALSLAI